MIAWVSLSLLFLLPATDLGLRLLGLSPTVVVAVDLLAVVLLLWGLPRALGWRYELGHRVLPWLVAALAVGVGWYVLRVSGFRFSQYGENIYDLHYIASLLKAGSFPAADLWNPGGVVDHYYYLGFYVVAFYARLSGLSPGAAYAVFLLLVPVLVFANYWSAMSGSWLLRSAAAFAATFPSTGLSLLIATGVIPVAEHVRAMGHVRVTEWLEFATNPLAAAVIDGRAYPIEGLVHLLGMLGDLHPPVYTLLLLCLVLSTLYADDSRMSAVTAGMALPLSYAINPWTTPCFALLAAYAWVRSAVQQLDSTPSPARGGGLGWGLRWRRRPPPDLPPLRRGRGFGALFGGNDTSRDNEDPTSTPCRSDVSRDQASAQADTPRAPRGRGLRRSYMHYRFAGWKEAAIAPAAAVAGLLLLAPMLLQLHLAVSTVSLAWLPAEHRSSPGGFLVIWWPLLLATLVLIAFRARWLPVALFVTMVLGLEVLLLDDPYSGDYERFNGVLKIGSFALAGWTAAVLLAASRSRRRLVGWLLVLPLMALSLMQLVDVLKKPLLELSTLRGAEQRNWLLQPQRMLMRHDLERLYTVLRTQCPGLTLEHLEGTAYQPNPLVSTLLGWPTLSGWEAHLAQIEATDDQTRRYYADARRWFESPETVALKRYGPRYVLVDATLHWGESELARRTAMLGDDYRFVTLSRAADGALIGYFESTRPCGEAPMTRSTR